MYNNGESATLEVTLKGSRRIKQAALLKLRAIETDDKDAIKEIEQYIASLEESLTDECWQDDFHLNPASMNKFFSLDQKITKSLEKIVGGGKKYLGFGFYPETQEMLDTRHIIIK